MGKEKQKIEIKPGLRLGVGKGRVTLKNVTVTGEWAVSYAAHADNKQPEMAVLPVWAIQEFIRVEQLEKVSESRRKQVAYWKNERDEVKHQYEKEKAELYAKLEIWKQDCMEAKKAFAFLESNMATQKETMQNQMESLGHDLKKVQAENMDMEAKNAKLHAAIDDWKRSNEKLQHSHNLAISTANSYEKELLAERQKSANLLETVNKLKNLDKWVFKGLVVIFILLALYSWLIR